MRLKLLFVFIICLVAWSVSAQKSIRDTNIRFIAIGGEIGLQTGFADLGERFGSGGIAGGSVLYKTNTNWTLEGNFGFFFGSTVYEDSIFSNLQTENGQIIGRNGDQTEVLTFERGWVATARVGRIFPIVGPNPNSGIHVALGAGMMQHKIKINDTYGNIPQLADDYIKGYDRLTSGFCLSQSIGYQHFSNYRLFNFYIGAEFYEGFTVNRRPLDFSTQIRDDRSRLDLLGTLVVRWYFPIYKRKAEDFYFY